MSVGLGLDEIGIIEETDKSSAVTNSWDYLRHYEQWLGYLRNEEINVIEIGVGEGQSLDVWRAYFPRANIIGVDIHPDRQKYAGERVTIEIGSQDDPNFLDYLCAKYQPTVVIDDGSHQVEHVIFTFENVFPSVKAGGIYIIEDLALHFGDEEKKWAPVPGVSTSKYFGEIANDCLGFRARTNTNRGIRRYIYDHVDAVSFISSAVAVRKKRIGPRPFNLKAAETYARQRNLYPDGFIRYCRYVLNNGGALGDATTEFVHLSIGHQSARFFMELAELQMAQGRVRDAVETLSRGARMHETKWDLFWRYGDYQNSQGDFKGAVESLAKAIVLCDDLNIGPQIWGMLIRICRQRGALATALGVLKSAAASTNWPEKRAALLETVEASNRIAG